MKEFFLSPVINRQGLSPFSMEEKGRKAKRTIQNIHAYEKRICTRTKARAHICEIPHTRYAFIQ